MIIRIFNIRLFQEFIIFYILFVYNTGSATEIMSERTATDFHNFHDFIID